MRKTFTAGAACVIVCGVAIRGGGGLGVAAPPPSASPKIRCRAAWYCAARSARVRCVSADEGAAEAEAAGAEGRFRMRMDGCRACAGGAVAAAAAGLVCRTAEVLVLDVVRSKDGHLGEQELALDAIRVRVVEDGPDGNLAEYPVREGK